MTASTCTTCGYDRIFEPTKKRCVCEREPLPNVQSRWCASCRTAFPKVIFSDDLNEILINFSYSISFSVKDPTISSYSNCKKLISPTILLKLGQNPECFLSNNKLIIVKLGWLSTILP